MKRNLVRVVFLGFATAVLAGMGALTGCNPDSGVGEGGGESGSDERRFVTLGTAPVGGAFQTVGNALANVLDANIETEGWSVQASSTQGSQQNIRMLESGEIQLGMSNSAITYHAVRGEGVWGQPYDVRAVATLAPNIGLFVTLERSGIETIADLEGKRVAVGPAGAGFEMFLGPILTEHGVTYTPDQQDFTPVAANYSAAVTELGDGNIDAAFMGGAIPTPAVSQAATTYDIRFVQYDPEVRKRLVETYPFFEDATIPARNRDGNPTYPGMEEDFIALNCGSMHLITHADVDEELIYQITKTLWEQRQKVADHHPVCRTINADNVARYTGTDFHPGAIRFYREIGIWPGD